MGETSGNGAEIQNVFQGLTEAQQKAKMRERVLRFWLAAVGNPVVLKMQEKYEFYIIIIVWLHLLYVYLFIYLFCENK